MTLLSLQKMFALLVLPAGFVWLLLLGAAAVGLRRGQRRFAGWALAAALAYAGAGNVYLGGALMARLESTVPPLDWAAQEPFDAVCVLGGGTTEDGRGAPELGLAGDRMLVAARLWHAGKARLLVASGVGPGGAKGLENAGEQTRALWLQLGIPAEAIQVVAEPCWITRDEIAAYRRLQVRHGWTRVALVSSASHLPRAMALAGRAGLTATPVGAHWRGRPRPFGLQWLVPQGEGFLDVHRACWEYLGRWVGR